MNPLRIASLLFAIVFIAATFGLALPGINVDVQGAESGNGDLVSPVSGGTVCVPYEYYLEVYYVILGQYIYIGSATIPLENVSQIYPGNFSHALYQGTNVSVVVYNNSEVLSRGRVVLDQTLPAGYYTAVNITPPITVTSALNSDFMTVVQAPNSSESHGSPLVLLIQELGVGNLNGVYRDIRIYLGNISYGPLVYYVYIDLRCYSQSFMPPTPSSPVLTKVTSLNNPLEAPARKVGRTSVATLTSGPEQANPSNLREVLMRSHSIEEEIRGIIEALNGRYNQTAES